MSDGTEKPGHPIPPVHKAPQTDHNQDAETPDGQSNLGQDNPFAPVATTARPTGGIPRVNLPPQFWIAVGIAVLVFAGLTFLQPFLGVVGLVTLVAAVIRVPMLQRYRTHMHPDVKLLSPVALLVISWFFMLACGIAACVAFCAICIPAGIVAFNQANNENVLVPIVFGFSGFVGLAAFFFLFRLSLRLPV